MPNSNPAFMTVEKQPQQQHTPDISKANSFYNLIYDPALLPPRSSKVYGCDVGNIERGSSLSKDGQKLYDLLLLEAGDTDLLPEVAEMYEFDLEVALEELRGHDLIDEGDPARVKLNRRELK